VEFIQQRVKMFEYPNGSVEVIQTNFTKEICAGRTGRRGTISSEVKKEHKQQNYKLIKRNLRRLALANNIYRYHMVLSFHDNITDIKRSDAQFKEFIFLLRECYPSLKYIATREFQDRGSLHYHVLLNQRVELAKCNKIWNKQETRKPDCKKNAFRGWIFIKEHKNGMKAIMYVMKYVQKEIEKNNMVTEKGQSRKAYLCSQGLKKMLIKCCTSVIINTPQLLTLVKNTINKISEGINEGWDINFEMGDDAFFIRGRSLLAFSS